MSYFKLSIFLFLILIAGCSKNDEHHIVKKSEPYVLEDIQWVLREGDGEEIIEERLPDEMVKNNSSALVRTTFNPLKKVEGSSHFQFDLPQNISLDLDSVSNWVSVPAYIELLSDSYTHIVGGTKVPFQRLKSHFPFSYKFEQSVEVTPKTQVTYQATLFIRKNTATFKAIFVQPETKKRFELTGKWTGEFYQTIQTHLAADELD